MKKERSMTESKRLNLPLILVVVAVMLIAAGLFGFSALQDRAASKAFANLEEFLATDNLGGLSQEEATRLGNTYGSSVRELILNRHGRERLIALDAGFDALAYDSGRNVVFYFCGNTFFMNREYESGRTARTGHAGLFHTTPVGIRYDDGYVFLQIKTPDESLMHKVRTQVGAKYGLKPDYVYTIKMPADPLLDEASLLMNEVARGKALILPEVE
jgi:hypothetical protein